MKLPTKKGVLYINLAWGPLTFYILVYKPILIVFFSPGLWIDKKPAVGVVYNAVLDEIFTAKAGGGAKCNDVTIKVSGVTELNRSIIICEAGAR